MCGNIDEDARIDDDVFTRIEATAARYRDARPDGARVSTDGFPGPHARHVYMSQLFNDVLDLCIGDLERLPEGQRAETVAGQAIVLARLAGVFASHLSAENGLVKGMMEAMLDGFDERPPVAADAAHGHHHHDHE